MIKFLNSYLEKKSFWVDKSYDVISSLLSLFILVYLSSSIYLHFSDEYKSMLFIIGANISIYEVVYLIILLLLQRISIHFKAKEPNLFFALYFSLVFSFSLLFTDLYLYDGLTKTIFLTLLFIIIFITFLIQRKHFAQSFKKLPIMLKVLAIIFSILNYFFMAGVVFMGQRIIML